MKPHQDSTDAGSSAPKLDREALGRLYAELLPSLLAWAHLRIRTSFRRVLAPEDLVQDIWLRATQIVDRFDPSTMCFRAWAFSIAKNVLFEAQRRLMRSGIDKVSEGTSDRVHAMEEVPEIVTSVTARVRHSEDLHRFVEQVQALDEIDRKVLLHCGIEGLRAEDVARRMEMGRDAVLKRWQRLRERVRHWPEAKTLLAHWEDGSGFNVH